MAPLKKLFIEAIVVGIIIMIIATPSSILASKILPTINDNHYPVMYLSLFITGVSSHFTMEFFKLNKWYCTNGEACLN